MAEPTCEFCYPVEVIDRHPHVYARWDGYPVTPGHVLLIPTRHVDRLADLTPAEWMHLAQLVHSAQAAVATRFGAPDAWTLGVNDGPAAGRTIDHLHMHLIPRRHGDVRDPRGGVRQLLVTPDRDPWLQLAGRNAGQEIHGTGSGIDG